MSAAAIATGAEAPAFAEWTDPDPERIAGDLLSPSQVRNYTDCPKRWEYRYVHGLADPPSQALALGRAVHHALATNFEQKISTHEDLPIGDVIRAFADAWAEEVPTTRFAGDPLDVGMMGGRLVTEYMQLKAPAIQPRSVELEVTGVIGGVPVRGFVDLVTVDGEIIDYKTTARKLSNPDPYWIFQLATYAQLVPGVSDNVRIDELIKTKTKAPELVTIRHQVTFADVAGTVAQYPAAQDAMRNNTALPNRASRYCNRQQCSYWATCQDEYGGTVPAWPSN